MPLFCAEHETFLPPLPSTVLAHITAVTPLEFKVYSQGQTSDLGKSVGWEWGKTCYLVSIYWGTDTVV